MNPEPPLPTSVEIDRRLRIVSELRNLCLSLGRAGRLPENPVVALRGESGVKPPPSKPLTPR